VAKTQEYARNLSVDALCAIEIVPHGRDHDLRALEVDRERRDNGVHAPEDGSSRAVKAV
jgi:hypothetical protein